MSGVVFLLVDSSPYPRSQFRPEKTFPLFPRNSHLEAARRVCASVNYRISLPISSLFPLLALYRRTMLLLLLVFGFPKN